MKRMRSAGMLRGTGWRGGWLLVLYLLGEAAFAAEGDSLAGGVNPGYHEQPAWFKQSFLVLPDDVAEASASGKRVLLYFYQDGCPYCAKLLEDNFGHRNIAEKTRRLYDVVSINIWGDREVVDPRGRETTEKALAGALRVQFTPTLLFLDERGRAIFRINGYYPPRKFSAALDFASGPVDKGVDFTDYLARAGAPKASGVLHDEPFFLPPPYSLSRAEVPAGRPLLVLFEQRVCSACDELHADLLKRSQTLSLLDRFDVVRLDMRARTPVITPAGRRSRADRWAHDLHLQYAPTMVFFDARGREVFRTEAYLRAFHLQSALDYVASGAYREQPNFQRFVQARADKLREEGVEVDLWK
jgi:thioredoxin-related protein